MCGGGGGGGCRGGIGSRWHKAGHVCVQGGRDVGGGGVCRVPHPFTHTKLFDVVCNVWVVDGGRDDNEERREEEKELE